MSIAVLDSTGLQAETKDWLNVLTVTPSKATIKAVNAFIRTCKSDGNWSNLEKFFLFAQDNQTNARVCIRTPTHPTIIEVNTPTWTANLGYTFNGTNNYLRSGWIPSASTAYLLNTCSAGNYIRTNSTSTGVDYGANNATSTNIVFHYSKYTDGNGYAYVNIGSTGYMSGAVSSSAGFWGIQRTTSTRQDVYYNGASVLNNTTTSTGRSTVEVYIGGRNDNGTLIAGAARQQSLFFAGGVLNMATFNSAVQTLATQIGFNV